VKHQAKTGAAALSILSNSLLITLKIIVGILSGSVSIISEAIHSTLDLVAAIIAFISVRISDNPPDKNHPYGHGKIENVSGVIEALLILVAAAWIIYEAVSKLRHGSEVRALPLGMAVMLASGVVNLFVSRVLYRTARATGSMALEADALHLKADVITSFGVAAGLACIWFLKLPWLDPIIAMLVAVFILRESVQLLLKAFAPLLDRGFDREELRQVEEVLNRHRVNYHKLRTRRSGTYRFIDLHVLFARDATLVSAHDFTDLLKAELQAIFPGIDVTMHMEPVAPPRKKKQ